MIGYVTCGYNDSQPVRFFFLYSLNIGLAPACQVFSKKTLSLSSGIRLRNTTGPDAVSAGMYPATSPGYL
jgi:hypothetical protein